MKSNIFLWLVGTLLFASTLTAAEHPRLLFSKEDIPLIQKRSLHPQLKPVRDRLFQRADYLINTAPPILVSITKRGEPNGPGETKGILSSRYFQERVLTQCMAFTLSGEKRYRDAAVELLDQALTDWRIWVDTNHAPPYDLMTGELCLTFGLAYDWLYQDLTPEERQRIRDGAVRRGLNAYLEGAAKPLSWLNARTNWNAVCNGGATVLALALEGECDQSAKTLEFSVNALKKYWSHLGKDGAWDEGVHYWQFGHRYGLMAAEALRRSGKPEGTYVFSMEGVKNTGNFPVVFNPRKNVSANFGDGVYNNLVSDPVLYLLAREYRNPDFVWFQDRANDGETAENGIRSETASPWPQESLTLLWRPVDESWLPEKQQNFVLRIAPNIVFPSVGWALMAPNQPDPAFFLAFKNGSLGANHTHLDLNHITVAVGDTTLFPELGSRPYPPDYFGNKRYTYYELSTIGHNTLMIGGKGQSLGKVGRIIYASPDGQNADLKGENFEAYIGVADGAYEIATSRARRHVVFVQKKFWVILDEIDTPEPQPVEQRFHSYGTFNERAPFRWSVELDGQSLVLAASTAVQAEYQSPTNWIKPLNVLSLSSRVPAIKHTLATVIYPVLKDSSPPAEITFTPSKTDYIVTIGATTVQFELRDDGWRIKSVK